MSRFFLVSQNDIEADVLQKDLENLGYNIQVKRVWNWEDEEETEQDYNQLREIIKTRKNPAILNRLIGDEI